MNMSLYKDSQNQVPADKLWEQPIFTVKSHVFQIDPSTKKKWLPTSTSAVNVSYYYDSARNTYRIISVENAKAIINSTIMPNMTFTKTSQKFGQWSDPRANTVYGLGFASELDCTKFVEKFKEVKELSRQAQPINNSETNGDIANSNDDAMPAAPLVLRRSRPSTPTTAPPAASGDNEAAPVQGHHRRDSGSGSNLPRDSIVEQLKYENDRLKIALAQSSANAKKWEVELQTLKNNNARLTTALQESTANVEEWKKQLSAYKEESVRMKKKVQEMEKMGGSELLQKQLDDMRARQNDLEAAKQEKEAEADELARQVKNLALYETQNQNLHTQIRELRSENLSLKKEMDELKVQLDDSKTQNIREKQQLRSLQSETLAKMRDVLTLQSRMDEVLKS